MHGIVPYSVQGNEILYDVIFSVIHYLLLYTSLSNDGIALVKESDRRNRFEHFVVVWTKANITRMTINASRYVGEKENNVTVYFLNEQVQVGERKIRPNCNHCENVCFS